jgi:hypothetical protein
MNEEVMKELTKSCLKQAMETCAKLAEEHAHKARGLDGEDAVKGFAAAIRSNSIKLWGGSA